jgi:hypothetical protein
MDASDALATIAEIAIAVAGFSGVAAVLGRRSQGEWSPLDVFRLRSLLLSSLSIVIFCFLPIVLSLTVLESSLVWALSSGAWATWLAFTFATRSSQIRRITAATGDPIDRRYAIFILSIGLVALLLHGANLLSFRVAWPYVAAATCLLIASFSYFFRLLRTILGAGASAT